MKNFLKNRITKFLEYKKRVEGFSEKSISTYELNLKEALEYIDIEKRDGTLYMQLMPYRLQISKNKKKTIAKKVSIVRSFVEFLKDNGQRVKLLGDESIKVPKTLPKPIHYRYIKEALKEVKNMDDELLILLIYGLGLRISEVASLKKDDIRGNWVRVTGKGDKTRDIPLLPILKSKLEVYFQKNSRNLYVFEKNGEKLSENSLRYKIDKLFKKIGIKATPHQIRHSYASDLLNGGSRISDVSKLLGHSSMGTTEIYTKLDSEYKMKNYKLAHPLFKKKDTD